jgi:hypothetical protein
MTLYETIKDKILELDKIIKVSSNGASSADAASKSEILYWVLTQITIADAEKAVEAENKI